MRDHLQEVTAAALAGELFEHVQTLYRRAYGYAVDAERVVRLRGLVEGFGAEPGFRAVIARSRDDRVDGMAFG